MRNRSSNLVKVTRPAKTKKHPYHKLVLPKNAPFELRPSPGKGWGAFATKAIKKGEMILNDPAICFFQNKKASGITREDVERELARMSASQYNQIHLLRLNGDPNKKWADGSATFDDIMSENCFCKNDPDTGKIRGTGWHLIAGRFNFSCRPNLVKNVEGDMQGAFAPDKAAMRFDAREDITPGTELTISCNNDIFPECLTRAERQHLLEETCLCTLCTATAAEIDESDKRRRHIRELHYRLLGLDIAAWPSGKDRKLQQETLIPDAAVRTEAEQFTMPMTSRFVYGCQVLALLETERVLNPLLLARFDHMLLDCWKNAMDAENKRVSQMVMDGMAEKTWSERHEAARGLLGRADPCDMRAILYWKSKQWNMRAGFLTGEYTPPSDSDLCTIM